MKKNTQLFIIIININYFVFNFNINKMVREWPVLIHAIYWGYYHLIGHSCYSSKTMNNVNFIVIAVMLIYQRTHIQSLSLSLRLTLRLAKAEYFQQMAQNTAKPSEKSTSYALAHAHNAWKQKQCGKCVLDNWPNKHNNNQKDKKQRKKKYILIRIWYAVNIDVMFVRYIHLMCLHCPQLSCAAFSLAPFQWECVCGMEECEHLC